MLSALEQALTMSAAGMQGVVIVDSLGARHTPAEVSRSLLAAWGGGKGGDAIRVKRAA
ncbi:hypothetical protein LKMONMHP_3302 [Methylobacterium organophilum]|uniref:Uncharacterized protein n=2 Tax=Methylobacterium organophilum TaxID=410 RepID=A0ABQ4TDG1_METOR|nr:hypothetical protein LKMONMHP_3302 [Methylobacterium organophilum]